MRYTTYKQAQQQAKIDSAILNRKVKAVKSHYYDLFTEKKVMVYTTILVQ